MRSNMSQEQGSEVGKQVDISQFAENILMQRVGMAEQSVPMSTLYIVGLPIGNAADISLRALWILDAVDLIACEDTRESRKLLDRYGIRTPTVAVHEHNERSAAERLIDQLRSGLRIALITDAGTPAVSDPGAKVVQAVREAGLNVVPIPGASAVVTAMSASGLDSYTFTFVGFVAPAAKARQKTLMTYAGRSDAFVLYEAPHRVQDLLKDLARVLSPTRRVVVAREVTKRFESFVAMPASELAQWAKEHAPKGEYVILVDQEVKNESLGLGETELVWARAMMSELPVARVAAIVAKLTGVKRDVVYKTLMAEKSE